VTVAAAGLVSPTVALTAVGPGHAAEASLLLPQRDSGTRLVVPTGATGRRSSGAGRHARH
jgi:hypothetical protein